MSVIPITTQIGHTNQTQVASQLNLRIVLVYTEKRTERQSVLMRECQDYLYQNLGIEIVQASKIEILPRQMKFFVIPHPWIDLIIRIRAHFEKPLIYLPRAVIEARGYFRVNLPARNLAISLTMHNCRIFLVQSCDRHPFRNLIGEMSGRLVTSFSSADLNVVISDVADNKYCAKAFKRNVPVVSTKWIEDSYKIASEEDDSFFNHDALSSIQEYRIKPFFGLYFKFDINSNPTSDLKQLITDNQGCIIYGDEPCLTHVVVSRDTDNNDSGESSSCIKAKIVDVDFLTACVEHGYYLTKREYREMRRASLNQKEDIRSQSMVHIEDNCSPLANGHSYRKDHHNVMLPPPQVLRPLKQQHQQQTDNSMDDMIRRAMSTFETAQTQQASTQMRRLPDQELRIEQSLEPSQQLYWNDRRN